MRLSYAIFLEQETWQAIICTFYEKTRKYLVQPIPNLPKIRIVFQFKKKNLLIKFCYLNLQMIFSNFSKAKALKLNP